MFMFLLVIGIGRKKHLMFAILDWKSEFIYIIELTFSFIFAVVLPEIWVQDHTYFMLGNTDFSII